MSGQNKTFWKCPICRCSWTVSLSALEEAQQSCLYCKTKGQPFREALRILKKCAWLEELFGDSRSVLAYLEHLDWRTQLLVWNCKRCHHPYVATVFQRLQGRGCLFCHDQSEQG